MKSFEITDFLNATPQLELQTSGTGSLIEKFTDRIFVRAGNSPTGVSTFARGKWKLDAPIVMEESFWVYGEYDMPTDFYTKITGSLRPFASMWNHDTRWRVGLWIDSQKLPRLQLETDAGLKILWNGQTQLPTGRHKVALHFIFSKTNGLTELYIDDILWKSVVAPNVPGNFINPVSTQILFFFDGANKQTKDIEMTWFKIGASNISPILDTDKCKSLRDKYELKKQELIVKQKEYESILQMYNIIKSNFEKTEKELILAKVDEMNALLRLNLCEKQ